MTTLDEVMNSASEPTNEWDLVARALAKKVADDLDLGEPSGSNSAGFHVVVTPEELEACPAIKSWRDPEGNLHFVARWDLT